MAPEVPRVMSGPGDTSSVNAEPRARTLSWARGACLVALAVALLLGIFAWHSSQPMSWERPAIDALEHHLVPLHRFWIDVFEPIPFACIVGGLFVLAYARNRHRLAWAGAAGCFEAVLAVELVFKPLVDRVRLHEGGRFGLHLIRFAGPMFPSAHTTAAASCAMFAWLILDRRPLLAPLFALIPIAVGCSVVAARMHYPADALAGMLVGAALVYLFVDVTGPRQRIVEPAFEAPVEDAREREPV
jgi:membrane-associated phospholipid phosphatase